MQQLITNKLYYNKYKYKIECFCQGINYYNGKLSTNGRGFRNWGEIKDFDAALEKVILVDRGIEYKTRCERGTYSFFFNDESFEKVIFKHLKKWVYSVTKPGSDAESQFLDTSGRTKSLCDEFPKKKYRYKVFLRANMQASRRLNFLSWTQRLPGIIHHSGVTSKWLNVICTYHQDPFVYVEDDRNLSMALLFLGDDCRKVIEYIPRSSINT